MTEEGGNRARGNARARGKGHPGDRVHAYATISFDYIIAFRPGGIIRVNKLHISFHPAPPLPPPLSRSLFLDVSSYCRDFVAALIRGDCLISPTRLPLEAADARGFAPRDNPSADSRYGLRKFADGVWGRTNAALFLT